jgi:alpha,alpha-trehalase
VPDALRSYPEIEDVLAGKRAAIFLDYDGTLTSIVARPDLAVLPAEMRDAVRDLAGVATVAIISGRDRADVRRLVGLEGLVYAGSHGFDIEGPEGLTLQSAAGNETSEAVRVASAELRAALAAVEGALVEPKRFAVAVHYRQVEARDVAMVEAIVDATVARIPALKKTHGKKVFELRPALHWDKGKAVLWLLDVLQLNAAELLPLYLGDDETDEDAFAALQERGIGIVVGQPTATTTAHYRLKGPDEVLLFLQRLARTLGSYRAG